MVLFVAAGLLLWGSNFASSDVHNQLAQQQITFPPAAAFKNVQPPVKGVFEEVTPSMIPTVSQYAGQQLLTGAQAEVYANNFIGEHLNEIGLGHSYSYWSGQAMSLPANSKAALNASNIADTMFKGTTLRGLLLEAYGFSVMGSIAGDASTIAFILGGVMLILTCLGLLHYRRTDEAVPLLKSKVEPTIEPIREKVSA